jgi:hypothetical protein
MFLKYSLLAVFGCGLFSGCGGGGSPAPEPVVTQDPQQDPQQPRSATENPIPDPQAPKIGAQEPLPNAQDPAPQNGGEGGASSGDP